MQLFLLILSSLTTFIKNAPAIISAIWQIIQFFKDAATKLEQEIAKKKISDAIDKAKNTKDTSDLENQLKQNAFDIKFIAPETK